MYGITGDGAGGFWLTGITEAGTFPVSAGAAQPQPMLESDAFLSHIGVRGANPQPQPQPSPQPNPQPSPQPNPQPKPYRVMLPLLHR